MLSGADNSRPHSDTSLRTMRWRPAARHRHHAGPTVPQGRDHAGRGRRRHHRLRGLPGRHWKKIWSTDESVNAVAQREPGAGSGQHRFPSARCCLSPRPTTGVKVERPSAQGTIGTDFTDGHGMAWEVARVLGRVAGSFGVCRTSLGSSWCRPGPCRRFRLRRGLCVRDERVLLAAMASSLMTSTRSAWRRASSTRRDRLA